MIRINKFVLLLLFVSLFVVNLLFAQGSKLDSSNHMITKMNTDGSYELVEFKVQHDAANLYLMTYGEDYEWITENNGNNGDTTSTRLDLKESGRQKIIDNITVTIQRVSKGSGTIPTENLTINEYKDKYGNNKIDEQIENLISQHVALISKEALESATGMRSFQRVLDKIYTTIKDALKVKYSVFATGKNDIEELEIIEASSSSTSASDSKSGPSYLMWILFSLLSLELIIVSVASFMKGVMPVGEVIKKFFICLIVMFFISNIWNITDFAARIFVRGGNIAGGYNEVITSNIEERESVWVELYPGDVMEGYFKASAEIDKAENMLTSSTSTYSLSKASFSVIKGIALWLLFLILKLVLFAIYTITALYVLLWQVELRLLVIIATFLLPFAVFRYSNFLVKGIPQTILGQCVKLFTATLVVRFCATLFEPIFVMLSNIAKASNWSLGVMLTCYLPGVIIISMVICYFTLKAPETARAILSGTPTSDGNIHGLATRLTTHAITLPYVLTTRNARRDIKTGISLYGARAAHRNQPGTHAGRDYALIHGGISTAIMYNLGKKINRATQHTNISQRQRGIGTDESTPNLNEETIRNIGANNG